MMTSKGYKSDPISTTLEELIQGRLTFLKTELRMARTGSSEFETIQKVSRLEGNIGSLEWVLREAETIKQNR